MIVRPLLEEEKPKLWEFVVDAFVVEDADKWYEKWRSRIKVEHTRAMFDDDGEMLCALRYIFPEMFVGGGRVPMPGLTNVVTPPENRRQHLLDKLLMDTLHDFRAKGYGISTLYPFYFPFYQKFGYEQAALSYDYTIKMEAFAKFKPKLAGKWHKVGADSWERLNALYEKHYSVYNGCFTRDQNHWDRMTEYWDKKRLVYIFVDESGQDRAYVIYKFDKKKESEWDRTMNIQTLAWTDPTARREVFAFIGNHDSQAQEVYFFGPKSDDFMTLLADPRLAKIEAWSGFMLRIVDAKLALEQRPYKTSGDGAVSFALRDNRLEWNDGLTVRLQVENGVGTVEATKGTPAGLECDIRQLGQLYIGYQTPQQLVDLGLLKVNSPTELTAAQRIFAPVGQPASFMADGF